MRNRTVVLATWVVVASGVGPPIEAQPMLPPVVELPAPLPWPVREAADPASTPAPTPKPKPGKPPKIKLQKSKELGPQGEWGASRVLERKASVKVDGATLTAKLTGTAAAYPAVVCPGAALATMRLVQPFTIEPASEASPWVNVTLSAKAEGYVRTLEPSRAGLRAASAAVHPEGGGPPLALALPPAATGDGGRLHYREAVSIPTTTMPAGCYTLVVDFTVEAAVPSRFHGFAEAVFSKSSAGSDRIIPPYSYKDISHEHQGLFQHRTRTAVTDPYKKLDTKAFGFTVVLKAEGIAAETAK